MNISHRSGRSGHDAQHSERRKVRFTDVEVYIKNQVSFHLLETAPVSLLFDAE